MLRFFVIELERSKLWLSILSRLQSILNFSILFFDKSANEVIYDFKLNQPLNLVAVFIMSELSPSIARISAANTLTFVSIMIKHYYDRDHKTLFLNKDDLAYLRLYKGYNIFINATITRKLEQQYVEPFKILKKIEHLAYKLNLSEHWRVNSIIIVAMLESASINEDPDPYKRLMSE